MSTTTTHPVTHLLGFTAQRNSTAWHGRRGQDNTYEGAIPTERVIELMDYPLVEATLTAHYVNEEGVTSYEVPGRKAILRPDTGSTLGIFKQGYRIHQPKEWLVQNLDLILDGGLQVGSAAVLKGGAVAIVQSELEQTRESAEGVQFRPYLSAATSHDGSIATRYFTGSVVVSCENQMSVAIKESEAVVSVRHSLNSLNRIGEVRSRLDLVVAQAGDEFDKQVRTLTSQYVSDETWNEFVRAYTGVDKAKEGRSGTIARNKVAVLNRMWNEDERVAPWKNSAWGVRTAVNTAVHHEFSVKGDRIERNQLRAVEGDWEAIDRRTLRVLASV